MNNVENLKNASNENLESQYIKVFGSPPSSINQLFLSRNIAHKLQENDAGGFPKDLAENIQRFIQELDPINMASLRASRSSSKKQQTHLCPQINLLSLRMYGHI